MRRSTWSSCSHMLCLFHRPPRFLTASPVPCSCFCSWPCITCACVRVHAHRCCAFWASGASQTARVVNIAFAVPKLYNRALLHCGGTVAHVCPQLWPPALHCTWTLAPTHALWCARPGPQAISGAAAAVPGLLQGTRECQGWVYAGGHLYLMVGTKIFQPQDLCPPPPAPR